jgi:tRNA U34 2-thiouridine synthase MnmA/TrmU
VSTRVIGLVSGGLDGDLACRLLERQGVEVERLHFDTGFAREDHVQRIPEGTRVVDVRAEYLERVVLNPEFGYGAAMNPCLDCRVFMLGKAAALLPESGAVAVATGEVVGKGRRTGTRTALGMVEARSGLEGRLLRPLSAAHLEPTIPEREARIDRNRLGDLQGRSRRGQLELARALGVRGFATPSGGCCRLADPSYARRLRDWIEHVPAGRRRIEDLPLLAIGRHLRVSWSLKLIVGRNESENEALGRHAGGRPLARVAEGRGSRVLVDGTADEAARARAAGVAARYSSKREESEVEVEVGGAAGPSRIRTQPVDDEHLARWLI